MLTDPFFIAQGTSDIYFLPQMANRHGLIAGATGTGKTITLRTLSENFSAIGVPVFLADVKGDLAGLAKPGANSPKVKERAAQMGLEISPNGFPVVFWDVFGKSGHPVRATISDMGPLLLSRLLGLNDTQEGVLNVVFHVADEEGLLLLDLKDLQAMLQHVAQNAADYTVKFGNVAAATIGTIQRALLTLQQQGAEKFFGEPALDLNDIMQCAEDGRGVINILSADSLMTSPRTYAAFMLWLISELFERLPEVGDVDKPKLVFFFDEAHLLFSDLPQQMQEKVEQVVRLIRSKGVGVYFVSQNPLDIPDKVLGQLGNRFQHALRAFTPRDQKAVKSAAETFRANPKLDVEAVIGQLGVGEALISLLDAKGTPAIVERAYIAPPVSDLSPLSPDDRKVLIEGSDLFGKYEQTVDRKSAYELLLGKPAAPAAKASGTSTTSGAAPFDAVAAARARAAARQAAPSASDPASSVPTPAPTVSNPRAEMAAAEAEARLAKLRAETAEREAKARAAEALAEKRSATPQKPGMMDKIMQTVARNAAGQATRSLMRGLLGSIFGGRR
ncbi:MAG: helicase HerA-like domain-containing protein [Chthoniobacteraceae bacterium]